MIPYSFTLTSHFSLTFFLSLSFFIGANIFDILKNGIEFLNIFLPASSPVFISPLLFIVELVSYFARVFILAIRLFANMMAGHALMKILAGFC
jgi:ATP synthase subunit 6